MNNILGAKLRVLLRPVYSDTTQHDVELSCVGEGVYRDSTQLN